MEETEGNEGIFGRIYKITSSKCDGCYIGSTTTTLCRRLSVHRATYKKYLEGKYRYMSSYDIMKHDDAKIELLHEGMFRTKCDLEWMENSFINEAPNSLNKRRSGMQEAYGVRTCNLCGGTFTRDNGWNHRRSKKHQAAAQIKEAAP